MEDGVREDKSNGVRDSQQRVARWLEIDISEAKTAAHADTLIYNAKVPQSMVEEAELLGVDISGLPYGAAKDPVRKARVNWSKQALKTNEWEIGTLLVWTHQTSEPTAEDTGGDKQEATLWVVSNIVRDKGMVTIKPFGSPRIRVVQEGDKPAITLVVPTWDANFLHLSAFRLREAKKIDPSDISLY